jgi:hypothetical protein
MQKTLTELATEFLNGKITSADAAQQAKALNIFVPEPPEDDTDDGVYSAGDGNSWFEVQMLVLDDKMTSKQYDEFARAVLDARGEL